MSKPAPNEPSSDEEAHYTAKDNTAYKTKSGERSPDFVNMVLVFTKLYI